ncbi:hypothetical protein [Streptococcus suis]|uniref:hypothetical protein n=1 Tax=Streptococcus suis TaxID=1307 RepID=UPI001EDD052D|nr:hypothetical protein [Streptococcus suis]
MNYRQYHTALVYSLVLQHLLRDTELEEKAFNLYADILERERIPKYQIKTASLYSKRIVRAYERGEIQPPSPFTKRQKIRQFFVGIVEWILCLNRERTKDEQRKRS